MRQKEAKFTMFYCQIGLMYADLAKLPATPRPVASSAACGDQRFVSETVPPPAKRRCSLFGHYRNTTQGMKFTKFMKFSTEIGTAQISHTCHFTQSLSACERKYCMHGTVQLYSAVLVKHYMTIH